MHFLALPLFYTIRQPLHSSVRSHRHNNSNHPIRSALQHHHLLLDLIETVEDFLEDRGISVPNSEKDEAIAAGESPYEISTIYGSDYGELSDGFESVLVGWGLLPQESQSYLVDTFNRVGNPVIEKSDLASAKDAQKKLPNAEENGSSIKQ